MQNQFQKIPGSPAWWSERITALEQQVRWTYGGSPPEWPLEIFLEVSNLCDLKCAMCPTFSGLSVSRLYSLKEQERGFLDLDNILERLDPILKHAISVHCFGYGEPTLHPKFIDLLQQLSAYRVLIDFFTNGMHLTSELCEQLIQQRVFAITISASGVDQESYENIYLGGRFTTLLKNLKQLQALKQLYGSSYPRVEINSIAFDHHIQNLPEFVELMADHGVSVIHLKSLQTFSSIPHLYGHRSILRPWVEGSLLTAARLRAQARGIILSTAQYQLTKVSSTEAWQQARGDLSATVPLTELSKVARQTIPVLPPLTTNNITQCNSWNLALLELLQTFNLTNYSGSEPFYCLEPFKTFYLRRSGNLKPCCFADDSGPALGNLHEQTALPIWNGLPWQILRMGILEQRYPQTLCEHCLREQYGPRQQAIPEQLLQYQEWLDINFSDQLSFSFNLSNKILSNQELIQFLQQRMLLLKQVRQQVAENLPVTQLEGNLDGISQNFLHGWLWAPQFPGLRLFLTINLDGKPWQTIIANQSRADLIAAGKGDGCYSFLLNLDNYPEIKQCKNITIKLTDTDWILGQIKISLK